MEQVGASGPARVGPFEVVGVLGQGGMGRVLLGAGPDGRLVAVKQVLARFADDEGFRARFRREVAASRKVSGAYTAAVIDADPDAPTPWLASVFVAGPSLGDVVESAGVLPEDVVRRLAAGLAAALAEIHRAGLVHRDLKPANVLLAEDGVRVIDLGIARATESAVEDDTGLTRTGWVVGSPAYMSPEQAESKPLTAASDVFSLGSVLAMALTGRSPFAGPSALKTLYDVAHTEPDLDGVPAGLRELIASCLAKDPAQRPSPARLRELIGPVAPAGRQWPAAVYAMLAAQRAEIDRLLGEGPVAVPASEPETGESDADGRADDAPPISPAPPTAPEPVPAGRRWPVPRRFAALAAAGVLLVAGTGVVAYVRERMNAPVAYTAVPGCREADGRLPLQGRPSGDTVSSDAGGERRGCRWEGLGTAAAPAALVRWDLRTGGDAARNAGTQRDRFRIDAADGRPATGLGFGTEAYWGAVGADWTCVLAVREGNLSVWVGLNARALTRRTCEAQAETVARAALRSATR
ncbi:serine/threonine-protein kinase [Streptomyces sp. NPDC055254]